MNLSFVLSSVQDDSIVFRMKLSLGKTIECISKVKVLFFIILVVSNSSFSKLEKGYEGSVSSQSAE